MVELFNEKVISTDTKCISPFQNSFLSAQAIEQSGIIIQNKWLFWEEVYFNLMAGMRKLRMPIPMNFTMPYYQELIQAHLQEDNSVYTIVVFPENGNINCAIKIEEFEKQNLQIEVDVFKDEKIYPTLTSTIFSPQTINSIAKIYAKENNLDDVLLLNNELKIARTVLGNIYYFHNKEFISNTAKEGARQQAIDKKIATLFSIKNNSFSSFELQKAHEVFISSDKFGIIPIKKFRKKEYEIKESTRVWEQLVH